MIKARQLTQHPPRRPLMIYDGNCNFCRFWISRWRERTGRGIKYRRSQQVAERFPEIPREEFERSVQLVAPDGSVTSGTDALFRAFDFTGNEPLVLRVARAVPGFTGVARRVYRFIADHRMAFSWLTRLLWGRTFRKPTFFIARWVFLRLLGVIYFVAFVSLLVQIRGLVGRRGILPVGPYLDAVRAQTGNDRYWLLPTVFWLNASDAALIGACIVGVALSCAVIINLFPAFCLVLLWALYLSLVSVCRTFLGYQWDVLLLETGFLSIFLASLSARPGWRSDALSMRIARGLLLWLLFRLTFESGVVKLASHDSTWRDLTALKYHYETQPLPIWTSWYLNQAPLAWQKFSALAMFTIEFVAPFTVIAPARLRRAGCAAMVALQALIVGSGNYCFFNFLTVSLCALTLDDDVWSRRWRRLAARLPAAKRDRAWPVLVAAPVVAISVCTTAIPLVSSLERLSDALPRRIAQFCGAIFDVRSWPKPVLKLHETLAPLRTFNGYGLFAVMTTERPEIVIEGSNDREHWLPYEFRWKPGDVTRRPGLVAPHQPRLDWQMWFAALGSIHEHWFQQFLVRLLEGSPDVLALLEKNPFPDAPPRYIRALLYDYHFTRFGDDPRAWWKRELKGLYFPEVSLRAAPAASPAE